MGWPQSDLIGDSRQYSGSLPKDCPCAVRHKPMVGPSEDNNFLSFLSPTLGDQFWSTYWSTFFKEPFCLRKSSDFHEVSSPENFPLSARSGSWLSLLSLWENGGLSRSIFRDWADSTRGTLLQHRCSNVAALLKVTVDTRRSCYFLGDLDPSALGPVSSSRLQTPVPLDMSSSTCSSQAEGHWLACTVSNATTYRGAPGSDGRGCR